MKHAIINNIPKNPKKLYDKALKQSYHSWIDEKGTKENPNVWRRSASKLSYEEAFKIIKNNKPHWVISFRNNSALFDEKDYWEFSGCNIGSNDYGDVFVWIQVDAHIAEEIFKEFNLQINEY